MDFDWPIAGFDVSHSRSALVEVCGAPAPGKRPLRCNSQVRHRRCQQAMAEWWAVPLTSVTVSD